MVATTTRSLSAQVAAFTAQLAYDEIPLDVVQAAKDHLLDAIGVGLAASSLPPATGWARAVRQLGRGEESTALGFDAPLPATSAALLGGTLIHSLEYDDTHTTSVIHGSSVVVPAALAMAERERVSGRDLLAAVVVGWEMLVRLGLAAPGAFQAQGFQTSAVCGPFAAAAIGARLLGLRPDVAAHAIGIAGSQTSGVFAFLDGGATVKSLHPGWAAHAGLVAGLLAQGGMTGPSQIFEGRFGLYRTHGRDDGAPDRLRELVGSLGEVWYLPEAAFKLYPCCHYIHSFLECLEPLVADRLTADEVAAIECQVPVEEAPIICDPWDRRQDPGSGYEAKFSLPYCLAALLVTGRVDLSTFASEPDATIKAVARKIRHVPLQQSDFPVRFPGSVVVELRSGDVLRRSVADVRGSSGRAASRAEIIAKFESNASRRLPDQAVRRVLSEIDQLDAVPDLASLSRALRMTAASPAQADPATIPSGN